MFWKYLIVLLVSDIAFTIVFAVLITASLAPMALAAKRGTASPWLAIASLIPGFVLQLYFLGLWAAYCSFLAATASHVATDSHPWLYFTCAFFCVIAPIAYFFTKLDKGDSPGGLVLYQLVTIAAFVVFSVWPSLAFPPYSWALDRIFS